MGQVQPGEGRTADCAVFEVDQKEFECALRLPTVTEI